MVGKRRRTMVLLGISLIIALMVVGVQGVGAADDLAANKAVISRFYDLFNAGNAGGLGDIMAADLVDHSAAPGQPPGLAGFTAKYAALHAAFPDIRATVRDMVAEGDRVGVRATATGTQTGAFNGVPATNKAATFEVFDLYRLSGGRIVELWEDADILGLLTQLGVIPSGGPPPPTPTASTVPPGTADLAANKAVVLRYYDIFNSHNLDALDQVADASWVDHDPFPGQPPGLAGFKYALQVFITGFPDVHATPQVIAEGDRVFLYYTATATNTGPFLGMPATGKAVLTDGMEIDRVAGGKIVETWHVDNNFATLMQIGAIPAPGGAAPPASPPASPPTAPRTGAGGTAAFIRRLGDG